MRPVLRILLRVLAIAVPAASFSCGGSSSGETPRPTMTADDDWQPQRPEFEQIADGLVGGQNIYLGTAMIDRFRQLLQSGDLLIEDRINVMKNLTWHYLRVGDVDEAIWHLEAAAKLAGEEGIEAVNRAHTLLLRGTAYLRQAEAQNCIVRHNRDCCILPLRGGGVHSVPEPAVQARASFEQYLKLRPNDGRAIWLLNILAMAVGDYPQAVPARYLVPPKAFASEYDVGRFWDIAPALSVDTFNLCGGVIADDFDGDGLIDIVTSTYDPGGALTFYRNLGDGSFEDRSSSSRLDDQLGGLNCIGADFDNDGDTDILVLRGAWLFDDGQIRNSLVRNNGDGTFTDVTRIAGLAEPAYPTQAAVWGDFDNDGDLDLYIGNESWEKAGNAGDYPSQLFRNDGDGTFTDVAPAAGVTNDRYCKGVAAGDYDNDGDLDLYVSNIGKNRLYRNNGDGTFTDMAPELGLVDPRRRSFSSWFFDFDNDGYLDLFAAAYDATIADVSADYRGLPHRATAPCLYRNNGTPGEPGFTNLTKQVGLSHPYLPMGANFGDLDNDGWLDIYLSTGDPQFLTLMPNVMLRNDAGRRFQNVTTSAGLGHIQKGHGVAFADFDNDGDQDIYHQLGGFFPGDKFHNALFKNPGHGCHYLTVRLVGVQSNRAGYGARIKVVVETPQGERDIHRAVGSVSSFGGSPQRQEIGLGDATAIKTLAIYWPASGTRQVFHDVPVDSMILVAEDRKIYEPLRAPSFDFAAAWEKPGL